MKKYTSVWEEKGEESGELFWSFDEIVERGEAWRSQLEGWGKSFDFLPAYSFVKMRVEEKGTKVKKWCVFLA